ncbi:hypothetical protein LSCM1_03780 [Leishmania martiniquensis]|uniref:FAD-binding FR-type domain-containing protein n=1 Tax=Leishmania martiniquensis TaxID=1580590 RepID=A0A836GCG6_9TRYP|nr:hypothetical protein LSCM1_03780 [Leishmania martiniquensis]
MVHIAPLTLTAQLCYLMGGTAMCTFLAIFGYLVWRAQGYYQPTPEGQKRSAGFTPNGIAGITAFFTFAGTAVVLLTETTLFYVRYAFHPSHKGHWWAVQRYASVILLALVGSLYVATGVALLLKWGGRSAQCAFILCLGVEKYPSASRTRGENFDTFLSLIVFFTLVPAGLVLLCRVFSTVILQRAEKALRVRAAVDKAANVQVSRSNSAQSAGEEARWPESSNVKAMAPTKANPMAKPVSMHPFRAKPRVQQVCRLVGMLIGIAVYATISFWMPNDARRFSANSIASFARNGVARDRRTANMTVPDMPYAWLRTGQIRLSENLTLKLFPGNVFFYAYLLTTAVTVFVLRQTQRGRYWAQRRIAVCACFTYGEAAFVAATLLLSVMFFIYWLRDHNYKQTWSVTAKESAQIEAPERWGRGLGQLAILFLSVLLLPVGRQSLVVSVLGVSRDGMLWFHRAVGYAMLAATVGHVVAFYVSYASFGYLLQNLNTVSNRVCKKGVFDDYSVLVATWTTWFLLIAMGVFGLSFVRRRYYELFYYTHLAATYMTLPVMVFHASAGWMYLLPGMTVFLADQLVRVWQRSAVVRLVHARVISEDTTELAFSVPGRWDMRRVHPGQYVLVCVPELTALQWHPFTLTNVVDAESVEAGGSRVSAAGTVFYVHVKSMGPRTWTGRLYDLVRRGEEITMAVEGPCGTPVDYHRYDRIVLIAGGVGASPCISIFGSLLRQCQALGHAGGSPRVSFIWSTRSALHVRAVADMLQLPVLRGDVVDQPGNEATIGEADDGCATKKGMSTDGVLATESEEPVAMAEGDEPLNDDLVAADETVHIVDDIHRHFCLDVFVTREDQLQHLLAGDGLLEERGMVTSCKLSKGDRWTEMAEEQERAGGVMGKVSDSSCNDPLQKGMAGLAGKPQQLGRTETGDEAGEEMAFSFASGCHEGEGSALTTPNDGEERAQSVSPSVLGENEGAVMVQSKSAVQGEGAAVSERLYRPPARCAKRSSAQLYDSDSRNGSGGGCVVLKVHSGRPDVERLIRAALSESGWSAEEASKLNKARTLLFVCGPNALVRQVIALGAKHGIAVHKEEFLF